MTIDWAYQDIPRCIGCGMINGSHAGWCELGRREIEENAKRAWDEWTKEDRENERAMARELGPEDLDRARDTLPDAPVRRLDESPPYFVPPQYLAAFPELGNHSSMPDVQDEALKLLGSFARFVQKESPQAAETLGPLAMEWARAKGISQDKLLEAIMQADEWGG